MIFNVLLFVYLTNSCLLVSKLLYLIEYVLKSSILLTRASKLVFESMLTKDKSVKCCENGIKYFSNLFNILLSIVVVSSIGI